MVGSSVHHQSKLLIPTYGNSLEIDSSSKREQECIFLLKKCTSVEELKQVHAQILKLGLFCKSFCASNLVTTCALSEWGSMDYACSIFKHIDDPDSFYFNTMIRGHIKHMNLEQALFTYLEMLHSGIEPDNFTYPALLKACARLSAVGQGMQIHGQIYKLGFVDDVFVQNSLINMYGKCGEIKRSCVVFEQMEDSRKTIASWSAVIAAYANAGIWSECLRLFGEMNRIGLRAEESILVNVLCSCTHLGALDLAMCTHGYLLRNLTGLNVIVETSLIDIYMKCGFVDKGLFLFENMSERNLMSYSVVISGLAIHGRAQEAFKIFERTIELGIKPDDVIYVGVLSACGYAGLVKEGFKYFDAMRFEHAIQPTIQHYGCMVDLMGRAGMINEAIELIKSMPMEPNDVLWRSLLSSCKIHQNVELGEFAAKKLFQLNSHNASDYILISNMYAKAQRWHDVSVTRTEMANKGLINQVPGYSLVEVKRKMYKFMSNDTSHSQVRDMLHQMEWQLKFEGYSPDTSRVLLDVDEDEKRQRLSTHSQKLAIAFALIHTSHTSRIRIVRNVRMCFGLAKDGPTGDKSHVSTRVMGTYGYAAPEYLATGHLTARSDVYSYGVVLLEMISGRRAIDKNKPFGEQKLVEWAKPYLANKRKLFRVLDNRLEGQYSMDVAHRVATLALHCISVEPKLRPTMKEIVKELEQLQDLKNVENSRNKTSNRQRQRRRRSAGDVINKNTIRSYPKPSASPL